MLLTPKPGQNHQGPVVRHGTMIHLSPRARVPTVHAVCGRRRGPTLGGPVNEYKAAISTGMHSTIMQRQTALREI